MNNNKKVDSIYLKYARYRIAVSAVINIVLIISTCFTLHQFKTMSDSYQKDIFGIKTIYITFIVAYSVWIMYDIVKSLIIPYVDDNRYVNSNSDTTFASYMQTILFPFVCDLIPILVVMILHMRILYWTRK